MTAPFELALSGHTHGGQVGIPLLTQVRQALVDQSDRASRYVYGLFGPVGGAERLFVSTGVGTTHVSARFGVSPEIVVLDIR